MVQTVILAGEPEYESDVTMRQFASEIERSLGHHVQLCVSDVLKDEPNFPMSRFDGLEAIADADLMVVYTRFRVLPDDQMALIASYLDRGAPVVGLRTSTHAFHFPPESPWASWNDGFGRDVLGTPWVSHHGHSSTTVVARKPGLEHPLLEGVDATFTSPSWLYRTELQPWCNLLLWGEPIDPESAPTPGPLCWVRDDGTRKVAYTSLGHPGDFEIPSFRRLLINSVRWCSGVDG
jgi:uncharacterized protein